MQELLLYIIVSLWVFARYYYFNKAVTHVGPEGELPEDIFVEYDLIVSRHIPYYNKLSGKGKWKFISRLAEILQEVPVFGKEGFEVTKETKVLLAASITQLTFGFKQPNIPFLKGVGIYEDAFFSKLLNAWVKGLAVGNGMVLLSWKHFIEGYKDSADTYNLGLHEFAHVLRFQAREISLYDERLSSYFDEWEKVGTPVFIKTRSREEDFFREYGGTSNSEFFSVCIENFFEVPERFEKELPELYYHLCYLMKQNPLNTTGDYTFDTLHVLEANKIVDESIPVYDVWYSQRELFFWEGVGEFILLPLFLIFTVFLDISSDGKLAVVRLLLVSLLIMAVVRWIFYKDVKAITSKRYLRHVTFKLAPLMALLVLLFEVFFMEQ